MPDDELLRALLPEERELPLLLYEPVELLREELPEERELPLLYDPVELLRDELPLWDEREELPATLPPVRAELPFTEPLVREEPPATVPLVRADALPEAREAEPELRPETLPAELPRGVAAEERDATERDDAPVAVRLTGEVEVRLAEGAMECVEPEGPELATVRLRPRADPPLGPEDEITPILSPRLLGAMFSRGVRP